MQRDPDKGDKATKAKTRPWSQPKDGTKGTGYGPTKERRPRTMSGKHKQKGGKSKNKSVAILGSQGAVPVLELEETELLGVLESPGDLLEVKDVEEVIKGQNGTRKVARGKRFRFVSPEELKSKVYREFTGRRQAFDYGNSLKDIQKLKRRPKQIKPHPPSGKKVDERPHTTVTGRSNRDGKYTQSAFPRTAGRKEQNKIDGPSPGDQKKPDKPNSTSNKQTAIQSGLRTGSSQNKAPKVPVVKSKKPEMVSRKTTPAPKHTGRAKEELFKSLDPIPPTPEVSPMMKMMNSIDKRPSDCHILIPTNGIFTKPEEINMPGDIMMHLTKDQVQDLSNISYILAFREVFDLFDSNGGGTIDAAELNATLRSVDICLAPEEINEVLHTIDKDGNGEIDFKEFLQLMTNTEKFLENLAANHVSSSTDTLERGKGLPTENLLFDALTKFMKKSALNSMDEITDYYDTKVKRFQAPHVVNHYAAGARLIGLTDKQLEKHLERIKASNASSGSLKSPYAQPLQMVTSTTNVTLVAKKHSRALNQKRQRGIIRLKIKMPKDPECPEEAESGTPMQLSSTIGSPWSIHRQRGGGWVSQHTKHIEVRLPSVYLQKLLPFDELTAEDLPNIRVEVNNATKAYCFHRRKEKWLKNLSHWKALETDLISPPLLRNHFRDIFSHYTTIKPCRLLHNGIVVTRG